MLEDLTSFYAGRLAYPTTLSTGKILTGSTCLPPSASIDFVLSCFGATWRTMELSYTKRVALETHPNFKVYSMCALTAWAQYCDNVQYA
ncbi:hypothetical protein CY34DRAFT_214199 [Suillus luteus UH-Slu-Lm8-n1]|uniref:Uncharacterized protein n=1 Tax=Suillus luteus UH-Slu-Lm8-n1 TaxID=930992 RepID=A0A0D0AHN3_9AGAM|nr:hypothetical protein CY34DRAFT_214199 [Suillus luteus UH-Slu-Lm8-n1]